MANEQDPNEKKKNVLPKAELSADDVELQANLALLVQRSGDSDEGVQRLALEGLRREIRSATRHGLEQRVSLVSARSSLTPAPAAPAAAL